MGHQASDASRHQRPERLVVLRLAMESQESDVLRHLLRLLRERVLWIGAATVLGAVTGLLIGVSLEKVYRAEVLLAPAGASSNGSHRIAGQVQGLAALAGFDLTSDGSQWDAAIASLRSRSMGEAFIKQNDLIAALTDAERPGILIAVGMSYDKPSIGDAYEVFSNKVLRFHEDPKSGLVKLAIEWTDPFMATDWLRAYVAFCDSVLRDRALRESEATVEFLLKELQTTQYPEVKQSISRLIEANLNQLVAAQARESFAFTVIDQGGDSSGLHHVRPRLVVLILLGAVLGLVVILSVVILAALTARSTVLMRAK